MKKLLRWLGYGLLLGCVLVGGYCVFLSSGLAERVFPPAVPGCMAVPVLSPSREAAFAAQEKEAGRVQLFITCRRRVTLRDAAGNLLEIDPAGELQGNLKVFWAERSARSDDWDYCVTLELCGGSRYTLDYHGQRGGFNTVLPGTAENRCGVSASHMGEVTYDPYAQMLTLENSGLFARTYTVRHIDPTKGVDNEFSGRVHGTERICFATADTAYSLEGRNAKWRFRFYDGYDLCWRENKLTLPAEWTVVSYDPTGGGTGDYFTVAE